MMPTVSDQFVTMASGLTLPVAAVRLALDLENRGLELRLDGDGLAVGPRARLTDEDRCAIRHYKFHLMAIIAEAETAAVQ
jgi:hypothetical protein